MSTKPGYTDRLNEMEGNMNSGKIVKEIIVAIVLIFSFGFSQIPNSGFENWTSVGNYMNPNGWATTNSLSTGSFYAVTRDTSHFPPSIGNYSVRIENDISELVNYSGLGLIQAGSQLAVPGPRFQITGHPTSLTGYYMFLPINGDTMQIEIVLFNNRTGVSQGIFNTPVAASNWTSFNISLSTYTTADSGYISFAAYQSGPVTQVPHGNSVLKIDNLNFDSLLTLPIIRINGKQKHPNENAGKNIYDLKGRRIFNSIKNKAIKIVSKYR